jgi:predicted small secreted protein
MKQSSMINYLDNRLKPFYLANVISRYSAEENSEEEDMMKIGRKFFFILFVLLFCMAVCGCNTIRGMGKDIEGAGETIQNAAKKTQDAIK